MKKVNKLKNQPKLKWLVQFLFSILILLFPFGHLSRIHLTRQIALYPHDLVIFALNLAWVWSVVKDKKQIKGSVFKFMYLFLGVALVSLLVNLTRFGKDSLFGFLYYLRFLNISLLLPSSYYFFSGALSKQDINRNLIFVSVTFAILGFIQYIFLPDTRFLYQYGWDDHLNRLISTFFDPGFTGIMLILGYLVAFFNFPKNYLYQGLFLVALSLTYSRASFLTFVLVTILLAFKNKSFKFLISNLFLFFFLVMLLPRTQGDGVKLERTYSVTQRVESQQKSVQVFSQDLLLGVGFNNYRLAANLPSRGIPAHANSPDNSYLFVLATTGITGLVSFSLFIFSILYWSYKHSPLLFTTYAAVLIHSFTNNTFFYPYVLIWLTLLTASEFSKHSLSK